MAKPSAWSLWLSSVVALFGTAVFASGNAALPKHLEQRELTNPDIVTAWLKANAATTDKVLANQFFERALKDKERGAWGSAGKGFCESALFYPTPSALSECANAVTRSLGSTRFREKSFSQYSRGDMQRVESLYRSAIAADVVLNTLSAKKKKETRHNADCLAAFIRAEKMQSDCQPLQAYGLK